MKQALIYLHGRGGSADESGHYRPLLPEFDVIGFDYRADTPWDAKKEFPAFFDPLREKYESVCILANSIGAYFAMNALSARQIDRAYFLSPIVDMEKLIADMLLWIGADEAALKKSGTLETPFGETLSWQYLCYVRENPLCWRVPTHILYGGKDALTSPETIRAFAEKNGAPLTVMPDGEHWFHTPRQTAFADAWLRACIFPQSSLNL